MATAPGASPYQGKVRVVALNVPEGLQEVGIVEASGRPQLVKLMEEFRKQTAHVGGRLGKVDSIRTEYHTEMQTSTESYSCGTANAPRTCTRTVTRAVEVATTTVVGRAFR